MSPVNNLTQGSELTVCQKSGSLREEGGNRMNHQVLTVEGKWQEHTGEVGGPGLPPPMLCGAS